ncbi:MAG: glutamate--tRNA ligase family protein [Verrucomicrobiota bacterium]|nr:glutamate--tRNA ligase family protein [Verrucomicrobiota bacterium]
MSVRVRFAPSPTGHLHIGGARTALFNWLYARHTGGQFVLRIEDTDEERNTPEAINVILEGLRWLGLDWDEGPAGESKGNRGPYFQSQRGEIYARHVEALKAKGLAYEHEGAIRFRMQREAITIPDLVCGDVVRELTDREQEQPDFVIVRSDGKPVFHLVNVIDDLEMGITHVIRGEDHLSNTAKHIALFRALDAEPPAFAHIPLILNSDGSKMSKRDDGASLDGWQQTHCVPEAVVNYLSLLGWSPKDDSQVMPMAEIIERFDLPQINRANARFDVKKMQWMNYEHLRNLPMPRYRQLASEAGMDFGDAAEDYIEAALVTCQNKVKQISDLPDYCRFYFTDAFEYDEAMAAKAFAPENKEGFAKLRELFANLESFEPELTETALKALAEELDVKIRALVMPARCACTGVKIGPSLYDLMAVLGRDRVLARFDRALARMDESGEG